MVKFMNTKREKPEITGDYELDLLNDIKNTNPSFKDIIKETFIATAEDVQLGGVHIDDWEKTGWAIPIVIFYNCVFIMAFFYFIYSLTLQGMSVSFLSLDFSSKDQFCLEIPITISTVVQGDGFGTWDTSNTFFQNTSIYTLEFKGSKVTNDEYKRIMTRFKNDLFKLSEKSSSRDAAWNAMMWSTFQFSDKTGNINFYSSADARYLYNGDIRSGFVTSANASVCTNPRQFGMIDATGSKIIFSVPTYPVSDGTLNGDSYGAYNNSDNAVNNFGATNNIGGFDIRDTCPDQFPAIVYSSWSLSVYTGNLEVGFDLRTIACAMSVNMGITKLSSYTQQSSIYGTAGGQGGMPGSFYYDQFYDSMRPFFCVDKQAIHDQKIYNLTKAQINGPDLCFVVQQTALHNLNGDNQAPLLYYPMAESLTQQAEIVHCQCPRDKLDPNCNNKNILMGLFYDKEISTSHYDYETGDLTLMVPTNQIKFALILQKYLLDDPINGDLKMQEHFTDFFVSALYLTDYYGYFNYRDETYFNTTILNQLNISMDSTFQDVHLHRWKEICPWNTCGSFIFQTSSDESVDAFLGMNNNYYQAGLAPFLNGTFNVTKPAGTKYTVVPYNMTEANINETYLYTTRCDKLNFDIPITNCTNSDIKYTNTLLPRQMCENTIYDTKVMDKFIATSPVAVVQPYFQCRNTARAALVNSVGNAAGTAGLVSAIFMLIAGIFFRKLHNKRAHAQALKVAKAEREAVENGGECALPHKIALLTTRESRNVEENIDARTMTLMFETVKCLVDSMSGVVDNVSDLQHREKEQKRDDSGRSGDFIPPHRMHRVGKESLRTPNEKDIRSMAILQESLKKLADIRGFDYNKSSLSNFSKKGTGGKDSQHDEFKDHDDIPFEY